MSFSEVHGRLLSILSVFVLGISAVASTCAPPRDGVWIIDNYETPMVFSSPVNGYIKMKKLADLPNVYTGRPFYIWRFP